MKLLDAADRVMELVIFSKHDIRIKPTDRRHIFNTWELDQIDLNLLLDDDGRVFLISDRDQERDLVHFDPATIWPFDNQHAVQAKESWPKGTIGIHHIRSCSTARARNLGAMRYATRMAEGRFAYFTPDGVESSFHCAAFIGGLWIDARNRPTWSGPPTNQKHEGFPVILPNSRGHLSEGNNYVAMAQSLALSQRYEWAVSIGFDTGPKVRFSTDPHGLRAMFRDRDKPADRDRRRPLRHWVNEHWRKKRDNPDDLSFVIAHLRGMTDFHWWGYDCRIRPSQFDLERLELPRNRPATA